MLFVLGQIKNNCCERPMFVSHFSRHIPTVRFLFWISDTRYIYFPARCAATRKTTLPQDV